MTRHISFGRKYTRIIDGVTQVTLLTTSTTYTINYGFEHIIVSGFDPEYNREDEIVLYGKFTYTGIDEFIGSVDPDAPEGTSQNFRDLVIATKTKLDSIFTDEPRKGESGYSHSGGFAGKPLENSYVWQPGAGITYTSEDVTAERYKVFSLDNAVHEAVDNPYWSTPDVSSMSNVGLFNGYALPDAVSSLFDFTYDFDTEYPGSTDTGFEGSIGRIRLNDLVYGDELRVRFDFNVIPQIANTTVEVALWYANRDDDDNITFTFPLTTSPIFYGTGSVGNTYLNRPEISAWIISNEDVNALTLPAIKADNPVIIQPLGLKVTIIR